MTERLLLEIRDLHMKYHRGGITRRRVVTTALDGVSLSMARGEVLGVVGESGSGKSTLGRCIVRLIEPTAGNIILDGMNITHLNASRLAAVRRKVQIVFQNPASSLNPRMPVGKAVAEPIRHHFGLTEHEARRESLELLAQVGLRDADFSKYPFQMSGGEQQRVAIARALSVKPLLLVLDEPTSSLDVSVRGQILNLLRDIQNRAGIGYLFITHDLSIATYLCDSIAVTYRGRVVEYGSSEDIFRDAKHPYTRLLFAAMPSPDARLAAKAVVPIVDTDSGDIRGSGCPFYARCPVREPACASLPQSLEPVMPGSRQLVACWRSRLHDFERDWAAFQG